MNGNQENNAFQYTYSAKEQAEIRRIRGKYIPKEENKMETLRRLDAQVNQKAVMYALIAGVAGALVLGLGMSCCLVWADRLFVPGVAVGVIGIALLSVAYPLYNCILRKERKRIAPQILRLTDELMK